MEVADLIKQRTAPPYVYPGLSRFSQITPSSLQDPAFNLEMHSAYDFSGTTKLEEDRSGNSGYLDTQTNGQFPSEKSPDRQVQFLEEIEKGQLAEDEELDSFIDACDLLVEPRLVN